MKPMDALQKLEQYVNMPSGSADLEGLAAFVSVVEKDMQALGFTVTRHPMAGRGDALECVYGDGEDTLLLIGHMDTVFAREENQPFAVDGDRLTGSGVMDMKGGVLIMQAALAEVLPTMPKRMRVVAILSADEEIGSEGCSRVITKWAKQAFVCLSFEPMRQYARAPAQGHDGVSNRLHGHSRPRGRKLFEMRQRDSAALCGGQ